MEQIKQYGAAGTLSYVTVELIFWAIAFPAAGWAYHQQSGEWLDVLHAPEDRAALLATAAGLVGAARILVPVRFAAALALTPTMQKLQALRGAEGNK
ncbi:unnamed protein product [Pedinophyceae sp. YPF-701]|nr:unnamed protein product [Pedinophyceae sp. YPF-701]